MKSYLWIILCAVLACQKGYIAVPESDTSVQDALEYYNQGEYDSALNIIKKYLNRYSSSHERDAALYLGAASAFKLDDYTLANRFSREIIRRYPHSDYITKAHLIHGMSKIKRQSLEEGVISLIYVIENSNNNKEREIASVKVDSLLPHLSTPSLGKIHKQNRGQPIDEWILFNLVKKLIDEKQYDKAQEHLKRYLEYFPTGAHADEARSLLRIAGMGGATGKIGLLLPLTGEFQNYGIEARDAFYLEYSDTHKIILSDTKSNPIEALIKAQWLVEKKVDVIIGPIFGVEALPVAGFVSSAGIPLVLPTGSNPGYSRLSKMVISLSNEAIREAEAIAEFAIRNLHLHKPAILFPDNERGIYLASIFKTRVEQLGGEISIAVPVHPDSLTMKWELLGIKRKRPDGIFMPVDPKQLVMVCTQMSYHELHRVKKLTIGTAITDDVIRLGEEYVEGIFFSKPKLEEESFMHKFRSHYQKNPGFVGMKFGYAARLVQLSQMNAQDRDDFITLLQEGSQFEEQFYTIRNGEIKEAGG